MNLCIAHGGDLGEPSGGTNRVSALAAGLQANGVEVTLVVPQPTGRVPERLDGVSREYVDVPVSNPLVRASSVARAARRVAEKRGLRLQFEHSSLAGVATLHGCEDFVLDMHDLAYSRYDHVNTPVAPLLKRGVRELERRAVERASHIVVVSEVMREMVQTLWDVPREKVTVVPNGYFPETVSGLCDVEPVEGRVGFLGTLHPKVDTESLLAVARLPEVSELVVVGDGAQREELERLGKSVDALRLTGRLPDEEGFPLLAESEVLINPQVVSPIQRSSSPVKLYYYAALGRPMVVAPGPSVVRTLVKQGAAVTAYSKGSFASRVRRVLTDDQFAAMLESGANAAAPGLEWSNRTDTMVDFYDRLSGETSKGGK